MRTVLRFFRYHGGGQWEDVTSPSEAGGAVAIGQDVSVSAIWPDEVGVGAGGPGGDGPLKELRRPFLALARAPLLSEWAPPR